MTSHALRAQEIRSVSSPGGSRAQELAGQASRQKASVGLGYGSVEGIAQGV